MLYKDIKIGDKKVIYRKIKLTDIQKFVSLTGDDNKLHVDGEFAKGTPLKKPVVHGMLSASFISTIIGTELPGDGALWYSQELNFLLPVRVDDTLEITAEVINKFDKERSIELTTTLLNQHRQKVIDGVARVRIVEPTIQATPKAEKKHKKVALVIGASGDIGKAISLKLSDEGFDVVVHYFSNKDEAEKLSQEIINNKSNSSIIKADISAESDVKGIYHHIERKHGHLTAIVNCATTQLPLIDFNDLVWEDFAKHIRVQLQGGFLITKYLTPLMNKYHYGKIIHITSQAIEQPVTMLAPYIAAKSALHGYAKSSALELAKKGIRVNMVSPSLTDTQLQADLPARVKMLTSAKTPLKRLTLASDIASSVVFLASKKSDFMTGETLRINGGQFML